LSHKVRRHSRKRREGLAQIAPRLSQNYFTPTSQDLDFADVEAKLLWEPHRLAVAGLEDSRPGHERPSPLKYIRNVYTLQGVRGVVGAPGKGPASSRQQAPTKSVGPDIHHRGAKSADAKGADAKNAEAAGGRSDERP
jgi:hypothetical protein